MKQVILRRLALTAAAWATVAVLSMPVRVQAGFVLQVSDGTNSRTIRDNGQGDLSGAEGGIIWGGSLGRFDLTVTVGSTNPIIGSPTDPRMNLTGTVWGATSGGALTLAMTQTGFSGTPSGLDAASFLSAIRGFTGGTVEFETWVGLNNGEFQQSVLLSDLDALGSGVFSMRDASDPTDLNNLSQLFSLTMIVRVQHGNAPRFASIVSGFSADLGGISGLQAMPEPSAGIVWLGIGGCMTIAGLHRRWRNRAPPA